MPRECARILTVLSGVLSTEDGQALANCGSNHERVSGAETVLVRLGQGEIFKVQTELANIVRLLDGHLASVSSILALRVLRVHEGGLVLVRCTSARELQIASC